MKYILNLVFAVTLLFQINSIQSAESSKKQEATDNPLSKLTATIENLVLATKPPEKVAKTDIDNLQIKKQNEELAKMLCNLANNMVKENPNIAKLTFRHTGTEFKQVRETDSHVKQTQSTVEDKSTKSSQNHYARATTNHNQSIGVPLPILSNNHSHYSASGSSSDHSQQFHLNNNYTNEDHLQEYLLNHFKDGGFEVQIETTPDKKKVTFNKAEFILSRMSYEEQILNAILNSLNEQ